jgi:hypothetical protein
MNPVEWKPGSKIKATSNYVPPHGHIGVVKDKIYTVVTHAPRKPYPEFDNEQQRYQFFCGQIIPEEYYTGKVSVAFGDFQLRINDACFELVEDK